MEKKINKIGISIHNEKLNFLFFPEENLKNLSPVFTNNRNFLFFMKLLAKNSLGTEKAVDDV